MKRIIKYDTSEGEPLYIEVSDNNLSDVTRGVDERGIIQSAKESFDKALQPLKDISNSIISCIKEISHSPSETEVELGIKFTAKAGIIITSLDSEAHFKITFKWVKIALAYGLKSDSTFN